MMELVDFNEFMEPKAAGKKTAAKRSRRGSGTAKTQKASDAGSEQEATA